MFGLTVYNNYERLLISDTINAQHFYGKATLVDSGTFGLTSFTGYATDNLLIGRQLFTYHVDTPIAPLVFIRHNGSHSLYAVIELKTAASGSGYDIIVMGTASMLDNSIPPVTPVLYCFIPAEYITTTNGMYGLIVQTEEGKVTFDSRKKPLVVFGGAANANPNVCPMNSGASNLVTSGHPWRYNTFDRDFKTDETIRNIPITYNQIKDTDVMFAATSVIQACYKRQANGYKKSHGFFSSQEHWSSTIWWAMYRNVFTVLNGFIQSGWGTYDSGYSYSYRAESGGWGGGGGTSGSGGSAPYLQKTINYDAQATVIISDASIYDE